MQINEVIVKPILTEKANRLVQRGVYTFEVNKKATKLQIAASLENLYKVKVGEVKVLTRKGKIKTVGKSRAKKQLPNIKLAYVALKEGKLDIFPAA